MRLTARALSLGTGPDADVPPFDLDARPGTPVVLPVETDERPQLVSLLLGGRLRPTGGQVSADGDDSPALLRRRVAVVDTPFASEPGPGQRLAGIVAEELAFAGRRSTRRAVDAALADAGLDGQRRRRVATLGAADRIRLLAGLAAARPGVQALVLTSPERHGGDPRDWFPALSDLAAAGTTVVIVTDLPTAGLLTGLGADDRVSPAPEQSTDADVTLSASDTETDPA